MNLVLLTILAVCAVVVTALSLVQFFQIRSFFQQARQPLLQAQRLVGRADRAAAHMETVVHQACNAALSFLGKNRMKSVGPRPRRRE